MGLASRRRYRWTRGRITDYWDEVFALDELGDRRLRGARRSRRPVRLIASLGSNRSGGCATYWARSRPTRTLSSGRIPGALVVDGGPGTGKTVVALHRPRLPLPDPRLGHHRGGVLFVGPSEPYLAYVSDVLPSLGEEGVQMAPCGTSSRREPGQGSRPIRGWPS